MALNIKQFEIVEVNKYNHEILIKNLTKLITINIKTIYEQNNEITSHYNNINIKVGDKEIKF